MGLIVKSAKLKMCERCGTHGRIIFSDDSMSLSFATRVRGHQILIKAFEDGKLLDAEVSFISEQVDKLIRVTSSPALDDAMDMFFNEQEVECNHKSPFGSGPYHGSQMIC
ncbi:MAG: hypothetical protein ACYCY6_02535 [Minisyncoccota bacterium]